MFGVWEVTARGSVCTTHENGYIGGGERTIQLLKGLINLGRKQVPSWVSLKFADLMKPSLLISIDNVKNQQSVGTNYKDIDGRVLYYSTI